MPISHGMHPADPYGAGDDDLVGLPPLPIPRPGEWSPMAPSPQPAESRLAPPALGGGLGGGASFTAAGEGDPSTAPGSDTHPGLEWSHAERERLDSERFTWETAARLTAGMLANPARGGSSVKDAMGLFDQLLQEMHAYTKIASEFDLMGSEAERRRSHEAYFHHQRGSSSTHRPNRPSRHARRRRRPPRLPSRSPRSLDRWATTARSHPAPARRTHRDRCRARHRIARPATPASRPPDYSNTPGLVTRIESFFCGPSVSMP